MHRTVGRYQGWKCNDYLVGLSRNTWSHLSDGAGTFAQGSACAKNTLPRLKTKYFFPMETLAFKPSLPTGLGGERRRIASTALLQPRGNAKGKLVDRKSQSDRFLSSKRLMASAFQVLRDLRNDKFSMGLFRLGRSASPEASPLRSSPHECSRKVEFGWSSALWEAELSNAVENGILQNWSYSHAEINHTDKVQGSSRANGSGSPDSEVLLDSPGDTFTNRNSEFLNMDRVKTVSSVNMELPNVSVYDNDIISPLETQASRSFDNNNFTTSGGSDVAEAENTREKGVSSISCESREDNVLAYGNETNEEPIVESVPAVELQGGSEMQERMERLTILREAISHHAYRYNTLDDPTISDSAYDALVKEMRQIESSTVGARETEVPMVGAPPSSALSKVQHTVPMLSLASLQKEEELVLWHQRLQQRLGMDGKSLQWVVEPKVDGLALSLRYENGRLVCACTRGNGWEGEDVTHNAQNVENIPPSVPQQLADSSSLLSTLEVRGEIFMQSKDFEKLNALKLQSGEKTFANPRNAAAGSMRLLASQKLDHRPLTFVAYNIANIALADGKGEPESCPATPSSQWEALQLLKCLGFSLNEDNQIFDSFDSALEYARSWMNKRQNLGYEADGVVFKLNDLELQRLLGSIGGHPRWAVAWKFAATEVVTVLEGIELTVGRTGVIVPNARLKPVELGGVSIRRATLHNFRHVKNLGLCEGDHVIVQRAGDVIPQVVQSLKELRLHEAQPWVPPTQCPSCGSQLAEDPTKAMVFCRNSDCSSRRSRQVEHFAKSLISGLGPKILTQLQEEGLVVDVADLYSLNEEALANVPRLGKKSARTLLSAIEESKRRPDWEFIAALGIPRVGVVTSRRLDEHFGGLRGLLDAGDEELLNVSGIGEQTLKSVAEWCQCESNIGLVSELLAAGCARDSSQVSFREEQVSRSTGAAVSSGSAVLDSYVNALGNQLQTGVELAAEAEIFEDSRPADTTFAENTLLGKIVVVTGSFDPFDRQYMHELVRSHGGQVRTSVTSKTSFVLAGENPGPKKISACQLLGIDVLDWDKFQSLIGKEKCRKSRVVDSCKCNPLTSRRRQGIRKVGSKKMNWQRHPFS
ncbi:hypothetical protein R1flu_022298 [Riccia fluitans]|uniref:DNA ligase (NAD(+)) n=1 Tax=Riccia fluitans TaxID=41844 RepID=A0ABD1ZSR4_9MARC